MKQVICNAVVDGRCGEDYCCFQTPIEHEEMDLECAYVIGPIKFECIPVEESHEAN